MSDYVAIATWPFGRTAVKAAAELLQLGKPALDAAIAGAQAVEDDPKVNSVGFGGLPNSIGIVQLDASVMEGKTLSCGSVAGVENIRHPAALARLIMEKTPHVILVGEGARLFAMQHGFPLQHLVTPESLAEWEKRRVKANNSVPKDNGFLSEEDRAIGEEGETFFKGEPSFSHDTVTVLAMDGTGSLGGACSTSGLALKMPGRVGDSPIIGAGLYVDDSAGAAGGTGVGEEIIRVGGSLTIVEAMRAGRSVQEACELAVRKVNDAARRRGVPPAHVAFLALDTKGQPGAACTVGTNFHYAIARPGKVKLVKVREIVQV